MKKILAFLVLTVLFMTSKGQEKKDTVSIFEKVEIEAGFPGGDAAWKEFLVKNLNPENAIGAVPKGKKHFRQVAIVKFVVGIDGSLKNIMVENDVHPDIEAEALRVIRSSPKWIPAFQHGRFVNAYRRQPLTFSFD